MAWRLLGFLVAAWALLFPAVAGAQISDAARIAWGFDRSDLTPNPHVRFGVLPDGMRYAIMRNGTPSGALSVRLRFDAGARLEEERERGYFHLIEHLLFQGTQNIPEGSMPLMLAHRGLRHWSDVNAFTSFDETVYRIDMMRADSPARAAALLVMREVASNLLFTRKAVAGAKRDVRAEIAARNHLGDRMLSAQNAFFVPGTAIDRGPVAGTRAQISGADRASLRRLYDTYYVPQRATLILVGDFDPAEVEAEIAGRFSDWIAKDEAAPPAPAPSLGAHRGAEARLFVDPAAPTRVTIATIAPLGKASDASRPRDAHFLEWLGAQMLNRRLAASAASSVAPFASAELAIYDHYSTARLARIEIPARAGEWKPALQAAASELRRAQRHGFSQAELEEQLAATRLSLGRDAAPRASPALADALVDAVNRGIVFTEPGDGSGMDAYLARIRLDEVNAAFRSVWARSGPLIFVAHGRKIHGGEAAILRAWEEAGP